MDADDGVRVDSLCAWRGFIVVIVNNMWRGRNG